MLKKLNAAFGESVRFLTVYTREVNPGDRIPQPRTMAWKKHHAAMLQERDKLPWTVAVDDLEGSFHREMGSRASSLYLVDAAGTVYFRSLFSNDEPSIAAALGALMSGQPAPHESRHAVVPLMAAIGEMDRVIERAGPAAQEATRREMPAGWLLAKVAGKLTKVPVVWRAVVAMVMLVAPAVLAAAGALRVMFRSGEEKEAHA